MNRRDDYRPGAAAQADVRQEGDRWRLVLVRELRHSPQAVWAALTDPAQLREWAPFDADRALDAPGPAQLSTVGMPTPQVSDAVVTRADAPHVLEYDWGGNAMRWQLQPHASGTRLTLEHVVDRQFLSMGAAGWHICFDVLERFLAGEPIGRIVAGDAMKFDWPRLNTEYAARFGLEAPPPR